jgi:hypothetical protein
MNGVPCLLDQIIDIQLHFVYMLVKILLFWPSPFLNTFSFVIAEF